MNDSDAHTKFKEGYEFDIADLLVTVYSEKVHLINPENHPVSYCGNKGTRGMIIRGAPKCSHGMLCEVCLESRLKQISDE